MTIFDILALVGGLACAAVMFFLGETMPLWLLLTVMVLASVVAGMIWALLPAVFKAFWNTNETLFTLMMNYVITQIVGYLISGDPTYITSYNNARTMIAKLDRDEVLQELVKCYLFDNK